MIKWLMRKLCTRMIRLHKFILEHPHNAPSAQALHQAKVDLVIWELRLRTTYGDKETKSK